MEYRYFNIQESITTDELKRQYRKLCMTHHPDRGGNEEVFHQINREYREILESIKQHADQQNNTDLFRLINEQIYSFDSYISRLKVPEPFKPAISYLVEKGINELGKVIKQKFK